jgi:hypothetical protein
MANSASWGRAVEKLVLMAHESNIRSLGLVDSEAGAVVGALGRSIAGVSAQAGVRTLLLDLIPRAVDAMKGGWHPRSGQAARLTAHDPDGFDVLYADASPGSRLLFNNVAQLRTALKDDLATYGLVVLNLPPAADIPEEAINPLAVALACDGVILVGTLGVTLRAKLQQAVELMRSSGVNLIGSVVFEAPVVDTTARSGRIRRTAARKAAG